MSSACVFQRSFAIVFLASASLLAVASGQDAAETIQRMREQLKRDAPAEQIGAAMALGEMGDAAAPAVGDLIECLKDRDPDVRAAVVRALGSIPAEKKRSVSALMALFSDGGRTMDEVPMWHIAAEAVGRLGPESLPALLQQLENPDIIVRHAVCVAIHNIGPAAKAAVPEVMERLQKDDPDTRIAYIYALMGIGPEAADAVPILTKMLNHEDFHTQYWSCRALGKIGLPAAKSAVPTLVKLMEDQAASVRGNAAAALGNLGPELGTSVVQPLIKALDDRTYSVRKSAAVALGQLGPIAKEAVPALDASIAKQSFAARSEAAVSRWQITKETEPTTKVLLEELENPNSPWDAASGFQKMGAAAAGAIEPLAALLESKNSETRVFAASSLAGIGEPAKAAVPKLRDLLNDPDDDVREVASEAIELIEHAEKKKK